MNKDDKIRLKKAAMVFANAILEKESAWLPDNTSGKAAVAAAMTLGLQAGLLTQAEHSIILKLCDLYIYNQEELDKAKSEEEKIKIRKEAQIKQNQILAVQESPVAA